LVAGPGVSVGSPVGVAVASSVVVAVGAVVGAGVTPGDCVGPVVAPADALAMGAGVVIAKLRPAGADGDGPPIDTQPTRIDATAMQIQSARINVDLPIILAGRPS